MSKFSLVSAAVITLAALLTTDVRAQQIGPGSDLPAGGADSAGTRLNIDNSTFTTLSAGKYDVLNFEYSATGSGVAIQPFLAELTGTNTYNVLWVGPTSAPPGAAGITNELFAIATEEFTLSADTDVYAGFNVDGPAVFYGAGVTDHNNPALFAISPGDTIGPFTNNNLNRSYAFEINVAFVPEPTGLAIWGLIGVGLAGFGFFRSRRLK